MTTSMHPKYHQNHVAANALQENDLLEREQAILNEIASLSGFEVGSLLSRSSWWDPKGPIGAFHYSGTFEGKPAVVKVQGVKPISSEAGHITQFANAGTAVQAHIRPPHLYFHLPWDDSRRYEALILESIAGKPIIGFPATSEQLNEFFRAYREYRKILTQEPWIAPLEESANILVAKRFAEWETISQTKFPDHPLRQTTDKALIKEGLSVLDRHIPHVSLEFQHGHFSHIDVYRVAEDFVVLSNLYWSWRLPSYDAIFAYHWHRFSLPGVEGITHEVVDAQNTLWHTYIDVIPEQNNIDPNTFKLTLLERALAGILLDGLSADKNSPITAYIMDRVRDEIRQLITELK